MSCVYLSIAQYIVYMYYSMYMYVYLLCAVLVFVVEEFPGVIVTLAYLAVQTV